MYRKFLSSYTGVKLGHSNLGKKRYPRLFENRVLRRMLGGGGLKRVEVTKEWRRKMHVEDIYNLYSSPNMTKYCQSVYKIDIRGYVHHSAILTVKNPTRCNSVSVFYYSLFEMKLNMFRAIHRPPSGA
jgi:hypothetical protein